MKQALEPKETRETTRTIRKNNSSKNSRKNSRKIPKNKFFYQPILHVVVTCSPNTVTAILPNIRKH